MINPTLSEWLNLIFRWIHVFAAIMWVGTTYYFTWLDARLTEEEIVVLQTTANVRRIVVRLTPWGSSLAESLAAANEMQKPQPLQPEAC